jgi:hypothetical protein
MDSDAEDSFGLEVWDIPARWFILSIHRGTPAMTAAPQSAPGTVNRKLAAFQNSRTVVLEEGILRPSTIPHTCNVTNRQTTIPVPKSQKRNSEMGHHGKYFDSPTKVTIPVLVSPAKAPTLATS